MQAQGVYFGSGYPGYSATITIGIIHAITATTAEGTHGMAARRIGLSRAAFVSPIGMVRGTSMEDGRATTDGKYTKAASGPFFQVSTQATVGTDSFGPD